MKEKKRQTNVEFVTDLMEFSQSGPLVQVFVIQAIEYYASQILKMEKDDWKAGDFISFEAWQRCAKELKNKLEER